MGRRPGKGKPSATRRTDTGPYRTNEGEDEIEKEKQRDLGGRGVREPLAIPHVSHPVPIATPRSNSQC